MARKRKPSIDNREALAYLLFRRFNCSRTEALAAVDELGEQFPAIARVAGKPWRARRKAATGATGTAEATR
jgi:hypothetical protein